LDPKRKGGANMGLILGVLGGVGVILLACALVYLIGGHSEVGG